MREGIALGARLSWFVYVTEAGRLRPYAETFAREIMLITKERPRGDHLD